MAGAVWLTADSENTQSSAAATVVLGSRFMFLRVPPSLTKMSFCIVGTVLLIILQSSWATLPSHVTSGHPCTLSLVLQCKICYIKPEPEPGLLSFLRHWPVFVGGVIMFQSSDSYLKSEGTWRTFSGFKSQKCPNVTKDALFWDFFDRFNSLRNLINKWQWSRYKGNPVKVNRCSLSHPWKSSQMFWQTRSFWPAKGLQSWTICCLLHTQYSNHLVTQCFNKTLSVQPHLKTTQAESQ